VANYPGATDTTARLLQHWFEEDHFAEDGTHFSFWSCQREAVETIIYLFEVAGLNSLSDMIREFDVSMRIDPREDIWPRYCLKMATGSGKTFVMALALVWQYFSSLREEKAGYKRRFLLVAPNLIVLDRLLDGFEGGGVFADFPFFVPDEWRGAFDLQIIRQSHATPVQQPGVLHITNCQQLYEQPEGNAADSDNPISRLMGPRVKSDAVEDTGLRVRDVLKRYDEIIVFNDEAHHAHVQTEWYKALKDLHQSGTSIGLQLDFTATAQDIARGQKVQLPHVVYNYPLKRAIDDDIVKQPYLAYLKDTPPPLSDSIVDSYQAEIELAVQKLREREEELAPVEKKPVLFIVCEDTDHADEVAEYIRQEYTVPEEEMLVIHTYSRSGSWGNVGDIKKDDLETAREAARTIDENPIRVVSSVMMLQEGWDVRNVSVILPLRAFDSDILVEQTLGRGLRRMFPNDPDAADELWVIEHPRFRALWREKIRQEDLNIPEVGPDTPPPEKHWIEVEAERLEYDITIPVLKGGVYSTRPQIDRLNVSKLAPPPFPLDEVRPHDPTVVERELMERDTIREYTFTFKQAATYQEFVSYVTNSILSEAGGTRSQFAKLAPLLKEYLTRHYGVEGGRSVSKDVLRRLNTYRVHHMLHDVFVPALKSLGVEETPFVVQHSFSVSDMEPKLSDSRS